MDAAKVFHTAEGSVSRLATNFVRFHAGGRYSLFSRGGLFGGEKPTTQKTMLQKINIPDEIRALLGCTKSPAQREAVREFLRTRREQNILALGRHMKAISLRARSMELQSA
jgi:hypothetical protein